MSRQIATNICTALPGSTCDDLLGPGHDSWKVGGKIFASIGAASSTVSVKTDSVETATMLIDAGAARRAAYFHRSWVAVPLDAAPEDLRHRLVTSYTLIRAKLPKSVRDELPPYPEG
ncbi:MmcQ/YjbR family DNA-binding protein [Salipiger sp. IMCC34102]|uniref:MmcQ/YjbR family DNA-binding protein n=1 Tax=Salipiger sp. IMCC34102 TaxID=2510647 RepID=UPI00101B7FA4|nr:MmcQ/YjbR family DNA-binding protein [Salipiger sp. IMCC34102]RYH03463.1 MmcQ/YjbR family DNA-binding protein [Salipiger sp. IMCC34102]